MTTPSERIDQPWPPLQSDILDALSRASVALPVWHLASLARWQLLRDTLLGHVTMRGGVRPRDLPLDPDCRRVIETAANVQRLTYHAGGFLLGARMKSRFGDWLYMFAILAEPLMVGNETHADAIAHDAVAVCLTELMAAIDTPKRDAPDACEFLHRLLGVLGISRQEWKRLVGKDTRPKDPHARVWESGLVARVAARACAHHADPEWNAGDRTGDALVDFIAETDNCDKEDRDRLITLSTETRSLISLKPIEVQGYIHRATSHWMMRGASTWCAQSLAFSRDVILESTPPPLLLSDGDALVSFVAPRQLDPQPIMTRIVDAWCDRERFGSRFPRLKRYLGDLERTGVSPLIAMPDLSLWCMDPTSLLDLCVVRKREPKYLKHQIGWSTVRETTASRGAEACGLVANEPAIVDSSPPWLEPRKKSPHGWTSLAWSLCGTTLRTHWHHGICEELASRNHSVYAMMNVHHGGWLRDLDMWDTRLVFVKLDGDGIGKGFESTPVPGRPLRSLTLGRMVLERVINATTGVVRQHEARGGPRYLPVDLVYFGGDDVVFCMPESYLGAFLAYFGGAMQPEGSDSWAEQRFSFISVSLPPGKDFGETNYIERSAEFGRANLAAAKTLAPGLRELVKRGHRDDATLAKLNDSIASLGYRCDWAEAPTGTGVAHGVSLSLVRLPRDPAISS
jgi:hypothetical protein